MKLNNKAQALVEYILIIALISIIAISLVKIFGGYLKDSITKTSCNIGGMEYVKGQKAGEGYCQDKTDEILNKDDTNKENKKEDKKTKEDK